MSEKHSKYSPSGAHRYMRCPGSVALSQDVIDTGSIYAQEGTAAHALAALVLTGKIKRTKDALGKNINKYDKSADWIVDEDMVYYVDEYIKHINDRVSLFEATIGVKKVSLYVEQRVDASRIMGVKDQYGTADIIITAEREDGKTVISVEDLKYGMGVKVEAQDNEQLLTYAAAARDEYTIAGYGISEIITAIHQPRLKHFSEASYTPKHVDEFCAQLKDKVSEAEKAIESYSIDPKDIDALCLTSGDEQCKFCKAKAFCPVLSTFVFETVCEDLDILDDDVSADSMPLSQKMEAVPLIEKWCKSIAAQVKEELETGNTVEGFKLVKGRRGNSKWENEEDALSKLEALGIDKINLEITKIISPAAAKKIAKGYDIDGDTIDGLVTRSEGKPTVAKDSDKRQAMDITSVVDEFDKLN